MNTKLQELLERATPGPLVVDDGMVGMADQARMLLDDIGTSREWIAVGIEDGEGFAEVVALAHPVNAALIVHAVNMLPKLVAALEECVTGEGAACFGDIRGNPLAMQRRLYAVSDIARAVLNEAKDPEVPS